MTGNRLQMVEREHVDGTIGGVDYGPNLFVIARSPEAVLLWSPGHSWSVNGNQRYDESHLLVLPDRTERYQHHPTWQRLPPGGGRLKRSRLYYDHNQREITRLMKIDDADLNEIGNAIEFRKTLLIEGGGPPLRPSRKLGSDAYAAWRDKIACYPRGVIT